MVRRDLFDYGDSSVRELLAFILPIVFVGIFCATAIPIPDRIRSFVWSVTTPFHRFLTLEEAEALEAGEDEILDIKDGNKHTAPVWRMVLLTSLGLLEVFTWLAIGSYRLVTDQSDIWNGIAPIATSISWFYAALRPVIWPSPVVMYDLFTLYLVQLLTTILVVGGFFFDYRIYGKPLPSNFSSVAYTSNITVLVTLLVVLLNMPVGLPSTKVDEAEIGKTVSPEDYCTLWQWVSFHWIVPLIERGTSKTLYEDDVWTLSSTVKSLPVFITFNKIQSVGLIRKLWTANSLDIIADCLLTILSIFFNYTEPFFLQRILASFDNPSPESRARAYVYAFLAFFFVLLKGEADLLHLWHGRRAMLRIRMQLMAAIYDKALKRKDFSGVIRKQGDEVSDDKKGKQGNSKDKDEKSSADVGRIVQLMSGDAYQIGNTVAGAYILYGSPVEIIVASVYLYKLLGWSAFSGFSVVLFCWPINNLLAKRAIRIQKGVLAARDKRMGVLNELIGAVKFIKFFAWENRWIARALDSRKIEMNWLIKMRINGIMFSAVWTLAPIMVSVFSFFVYVYLGNQLTVSVAFTAISLFTMIRGPLGMVPTWIVFVLQGRVAAERIATYLDEDEVDDNVSSLKTGYSQQSEQDSRKLLGISNGTFRWNEVEQKDKNVDHGKSPSTATVDSDTVVDAESSDEYHRFELRDISVTFPEAKLTVVSGPTASGKTALLMSLLGEMTKLEGESFLSKNPFEVDEYGNMCTISYAAQAPWLQHLSIKDNILFGYPFEEDRYQQVLECCALKPDLDILEDGDNTEIGARGVTLSGGQKARVALARAVYARTQYVLLDDPLSAVDSHTARFLVDKLLCGPLLAHRTVVLVTHHVELVLPGTHYLIRMLDGRIDIQGTVEDLRAQGILNEITLDESVRAKEDERMPEVVDPEALAIEGEAEEKPAFTKTPRKLIKDEHRETGSVKWSVYKTYLKASSYMLWIVLLVLIVVQQLCTVGEKVWIKYWGSAYNATITTSSFFSSVTPEHQVVSNALGSSYQLGSNYHHSVHGASFSPALSLPNANRHPMFYISIYAAICIGGGLVGLVIVCIQYLAALKASRKLFKQLLVTIVSATMRWHDTTPAGRLLNRFSKDIETIDSSLAGTIQAVNSSLATFLSSVLVIVFVFPFFLIPAALIGYLYQRLAVGYLNTGRDLRRMESISRSPIFSGFGELLEGIVTVRAFNAEKRFADGLHVKIDVTNRMFYNFWMLNRHLLLHFDVLGGVAVLVTTLFSLSGIVEAGTAGVCITSAMSFTVSIYWACRFWTALELDLNSVERVVEFLDLPQEPPTIIESNRPPAYWPSSSNNDALLVVEDLTIKYAPELPSVLHGVSFTLKARERVGLLGRTGSGKSTLAMSLLRFVDPSGGRILIDNIDICKIGLSDLRSRVTFIPQDATLFSGTVRDNLDPFGDHDDTECLDVLYRVHMISESAHQSQKSSHQPSRSPSIHELERNDTESTAASATIDTESRTKITLDTQVSTGGSNFSSGQRQLIAMARALLRRSSIIILDEATSSIDFSTDTKIQATIREEFTDSLLLTVAHRLRTVIDYDRLIVLDKGEIVEFDTPYNLIRKEDGIFRNMALKSGMFAELENAATKAESANQI